jgi:preprotein translocase subunit SecA
MTLAYATKEYVVRGIFDRFAKRYQRLQERKTQAREVVDPNAPPLPDMPVEQVQSERTIGRNEPCPCGSGLKYKKCCGRAP